jgi:hypothetical protein
MNVSKAAKIWLDYHQLNSKKKHPALKFIHHSGNRSSGSRLFSQLKRLTG